MKNKIGVIVLASISLLSVFACKSEEDKYFDEFASNFCGVWEATEWKDQKPDGSVVYKLKDGPLVIEIRRVKKSTQFDVIARHNGIVISPSGLYISKKKEDQDAYRVGSLILGNSTFRIKVLSLSSNLEYIYSGTYYSPQTDRYLTNNGIETLRLTRTKKKV